MFPYKKLFWITALVVAGYFILPHSVPILLALITAIVLEPTVRALQKSLRINRALAVALTFVLFLLVFSGLVYFVTTQLVVQIVELSQGLPQMFISFLTPIRSWIEMLQSYFNQLPPGYSESMTQALNTSFHSLNTLTVSLLQGLGNFIKSLPDLMVVAVVYVIALFLLALDLPNLVQSFLRLFDEETQLKLLIVIQNLNRAVIGFLQAQVLISFLTYDLVLIGLWILGVKYALAVALIIVLVDVLPVLGTGAVMIPWMTYAFLKGNESLGIGLLVLFLLIMIFRRIIEPKILGNSLGISPLFTLISMYLGFKIFGFLGMMLGPAAVILYNAFREAGFFKFRIHL